MIALDLLVILVCALLLASVCGAVVVAIEWWQMRRQFRRLPAPPRTARGMCDEYQRNERAWKGLR